MIINPGSARHGAQMQLLMDFIGAASIEYKDLGNGEDYMITRQDGKKLILKARGGREGGFLAIDDGVNDGSRPLLDPVSMGG